MNDHDFLSVFEDDDADRLGSNSAGLAEGDDNRKAENAGIVQRLHIPEALVAIAITALLAIAPFVAHASPGDADANSSNVIPQAQENAADSSASTASDADLSNSASARSASAEASQKAADGLSAKKSKTVYANGKKIATSNDGARGLSAAGKGTIVAGDLTVTTKGAKAPAIAADAKAKISLVNSTLKTSGVESPLVSTAGSLEMENVTGQAGASPIADVRNGGSLIVSNSTLSSGYEGIAEKNSLIEGITNAVTSGTTDAVSGAIVIYGTDDDASKTSLIQVTGSTLTSAIESGALFYLTNSQSKIVLSNVELEFDSDSANLVTAAGNNVDGWGKAGKNGATSTFTSLGNQISGNVTVDTTSTLEFFLLAGSSWKGASSIDSNTTGETSKMNLTVSIDSTSSWMLTGDSTVSNLNLETGGKLVDEDGNAVKIVDADGNTLVDGASDVEVKVTGNFATTVTTADEDELQEATIDRNAYDEKYDTSTSFGTNGKATSPSVEDEARERAAYIKEWFAKL